MLDFIKKIENDLDYLGVELTKEDREKILNSSTNDLGKYLNNNLDWINASYGCLLETIVSRLGQEKTPKLENIKIESEEIDALNFEDMKDILLNDYNHDIEGYEIEDVRIQLYDNLAHDAKQAEEHMLSIIKFIPIKHYNNLVDIRTFINNELDNLNKDGYIGSFFVENVNYKVVIK